MIRYFCDVCGKEITREMPDNRRLTAEAGRLRIEVVTAIDNAWNGGHVCHDCIRAAIAATAKGQDNG